MLSGWSAKQVVVLGSYSNALPGQESPSGPAPPTYRVSDETAFSSMPYVEWQQLEVKPVLAPHRVQQIPSMHTNSVQDLASVSTKALFRDHALLHLRTIWGSACLMLQDIDPLTDKAYTHLVLPPWPFWRACEAAGLPVMLLMLAVSEVSVASMLHQPLFPQSGLQLKCRASFMLISSVAGATLTR